MRKKILFGLSMLIASMTAFATSLDVKDGENKSARISVKDPTRVKVEGDQITDVFGRDIRSPDNPNGALMLSGDKAKGEVFIQPVDGTPIGKASSLFIVTNSATYTLLAVTTDTPGETLSLRDVGKHGATNVGDAAYRPPLHLREMKRLVKDMASQKPANNIQTIDVSNGVIPLWQEARFVLEKRYETGDRWKGEKYLLTNISTAPMVLDEREFYNDATIATIAVENPELLPGQSTEIYIVRDGAQ